MSPRVRLSPPQIGRLLARGRRWAWIHTRQGDFGKALQATDQPGQPWLVSIEGVEEYAGVKFLPEQVAAAINPRGTNAG